MDQIISECCGVFWDRGINTAITSILVRALTKHRSQLSNLLNWLQKMFYSHVDIHAGTSLEYCSPWLMFQAVWSISTVLQQLRVIWGHSVKHLEPVNVWMYLPLLFMYSWLGSSLLIRTMTGIALHVQSGAVVTTRVVLAGIDVMVSGLVVG